MPRMRILNAAEKETFDSPPEFNAAQRKQYFDFPMAIERIAASLRSPVNRLGFLISCGYFKATKRFFTPSSIHVRDIEYVATRLGINPADSDLSYYDKQSIARHQQLILNYYGFRAFDQKARIFITQEIESMVCAQLKPRLIFWRCVDLLIREKVQVPNYFRIADLILRAVNDRKRTLTRLIGKILTRDARELLDSLFIQGEPDDQSESPPSRTTAYQLTLLKKLSQSTKPSKVKERVGDLELLADLYHRLDPVIQTLGLNHDSIQYYANSVVKTQSTKIARRSDEDRYLHTTTFVVHQYYRLQDNLVDVLLTSVQTFNNSAEREHKELCYTRREQRNTSVKALVNTLDDQLLGTLSAIDTILYQRDIAPMIGVGVTDINLWETHTRAPRVKYYPKIMEFLGYCPIQYAKSFGELLALHRTHGGYSMTALARKLGVDKKTVAGWEREEHTATRSLKQRIINFFGIRHELS